MSKILCIYYSRSGNTRQAMEEISKALHAELVELKDETDRSGWKGWLRSGLDAMRRTAEPLLPYKTEHPLKEYDLVILGTPVWAGRCSSIVRSFLKTHGHELKRTAYVLTRKSENKYEDIYDQMDLYTEQPHSAAVSLRWDSVGYAFWQEQFLRQIHDVLDQQ